MPNFKDRSRELELMDYPIEDKREIFLNFKELVFINEYLGGAIHSYREIKRLERHKDSLWIADIGSGAGDFLDYLNRRKGGFSGRLKLTGVDMMVEAHEYSRECFPDIASQVEWVEQDYRDWFLEGNRPDILHASLFCHHLTDAQLIEFFRLSVDQAQIAVIVNDLHRHPMAYYSIKWLTQLFSKSRFTKNDAPLSVLRGFKRSELESLLQRAGVENFSIQWKWAFRYIITILPND